MQFDLSPALIDEILFYMEDQNGEFLLDTQEGLVLNTEDEAFDADAFDADDDRYISLPEWGPSDGFRLMERFTAGIHNALVREELSAALDRGRGVFRAFKNTLSRYPETEKRWFDHKDREMKREVIAWYNALRESWGLELIGAEPEDTDGPALEDFHFREGTQQDRHNAEQLHDVCQNEYIEWCTAKKINAAVVTGLSEWFFPGDLCFTAETAGGEFAGYISAVRLSDTVLGVCAVEVQPEFRGMGIGKTLIARLLEQADSRDIPDVIIDIPAGQEHFSRALLREYFTPCVQRYSRQREKLK